jgi:L-ascorbate metabolism protein UlaG (beta-lactamase superfamily)
MSHQKLYRFAASTLVEPLINRWPIWSDLLSPVPYSLHVANYQLPLLRSYVEDPASHEEAAVNPDLVGAPFANVPARRSEEMREFLETTEREHRDSIEFAEALNHSYDELVKTAKGQCLDEFYERLPQPLRGRVELVYDYNCNPIIRTLENFFYASSLYKPHLQSLRLLEQKSDSSRPFFLNTPRLDQTDQMEWRIPFDKEEIDLLFETDIAPRPLGFLRELMGLDEGAEPALAALLTNQEARPSGEWKDEAVRIRYFGHACVLVQAGGISVMTDPWVSPRSSQSSLEHYSFDDLPQKIDFAVVTHGHHDHFVPETLLRLRKRIGCLVVPHASGIFHADTSLRLAAQRLGFHNVVEVDPLDRISFGHGEIIAAPFFGEHADLAHCKSGYVVRAGGRQILFAADSNCVDGVLYRNLRHSIGEVDTVFLGMECVGAPLSWLYGALMPFRLPRNLDQSRRTKACDANAALTLLKELGSAQAFVYAMGAEPWLEFRMGLGCSGESEQGAEAERFVGLCKQKGIGAKRLFGQHETVLPSSLYATVAGGSQ